MKFQNKILLSDLDGTLLNAKREVSQENIEAIQYFVDNGGKFGIATGRDIENVWEFYHNVPVNFFCIFSNGSVLFDKDKKEVLAEVSVDKTKIMPFLAECRRLHPEIGIQLHTNLGTVFVPDMSNVNPDTASGHKPYICKKLEDCTDLTIRKVLFLTPEGDFDWLKSTSESLDSVVSRVQSSKFYYEFLPKGSSKGAMVEELRKRMSPEEKLYAVGDFYNDIEMVLGADVGILCENAPEELKKQVKHITVNHNESVISDVVHRIIESGI